MPRPYHVEDMNKVLAALKDASCPFLSIAAQRAGVSKHTASDWVIKGRIHISEDKDTPAARFVTELERIQGDWKNEAMATIAAADKETAQGANNIRWLLERLDRETFDTTRPALNAPKGETSKPKPPSPEKMKELEEDLARPESMQ